MTYGDLPEDLGIIDISPVEMMCWLYCPISTPGEIEQVPPNLEQFQPIIDAVYAYDPNLYEDSYVYITAKTLWVSGNNIGNRPGWHSDGFGTDDVNYIWHDRAPTQFVDCPEGFTLPDDCDNAMEVMAHQASVWPVVTYPDKHLLRLTPSVIHRSPVSFAPGMRTFVKVSISKDRYNLIGNSINHGLKERWPLVPRFSDRNHPARDYE